MEVFTKHSRGLEDKMLSLSLSKSKDELDRLKGKKRIVDTGLI